MNVTMVNFKGSYLKVIKLFVPLILTINQLCYGQSDSTQNLPLVTYSDSAAIATNSYFYFDLGFTNNNINSTEYQDETLPASILDVSFYHKSGFWGGILPVYYHNTNDFSYDLDFSLGYQNFFGNYFDANLYYTNHNFSGDTTVQGIDFNHAINLSFGCDLGWLYLFSDGYVNFGVSNNYFTDLGFALYTERENIFSPNDYISIMPIFSATFGTDYWFYDDFPERRKTLVENYLNKNGYDTQNFGYIGLDLIFMLSYNYKNLGLGASFNYNIPGNKFKQLDWTNQSGFMFSINYLLNLK